MLKAKSKKKVESNEGFVIDNKGKANWALRKIRHLKKKQVENEELDQKEKLN